MFEIITQWQYDYLTHCQPEENSGEILAEQGAEIPVSALVRELMSTGSIDSPIHEGEFDDSDDLEQDIPGTYDSDLLDSYVYAQDHSSLDPNVTSAAINEEPAIDETASSEAKQSDDVS